MNSTVGVHYSMFTRLKMSRQLCFNPATSIMKMARNPEANYQALCSTMEGTTEHINPRLVQLHGQYYTCPIMSFFIKVTGCGD